MVAVLLSKDGVGLGELPNPMPLYNHPVYPKFEHFTQVPTKLKYERWFRSYRLLTVYPYVSTMWFYEEISGNHR